MRRCGAALALTWLLLSAGGCGGDPYALPLVEPARYGNDEKATIQFGPPQVFAREALINDRRAEQAYLDTLLKESATVDFKPQVVRELESLTRFAAQLQAGFNPSLGAASGRAEQLAELDTDIAVAERQAQLAILEARLNAVRREIETGAVPESAAGEAAADAAGEITAPELPTIPAELAKLGETITGMKALLKDRDGLIDVSAATDIDPREDFRDRQAYRSDLRKAMGEALLDDAHDAAGNALYRLQLPATVLPGWRNDGYGVARLSMQRPKMSDEEMEGLYRSWLAHLSYRINASPDQFVDSKKPRDSFRSRHYEAAAIGTGFADLAHLYFSNLQGLTALDPCLQIASMIEAATLGCYEFTVAVPPGLKASLEPPFPGFEDEILVQYQRWLRESGENEEIETTVGNKLRAKTVSSSAIVPSAGIAQASATADNAETDKRACPGAGSVIKDAQVRATQDLAFRLRPHRPSVLGIEATSAPLYILNKNHDEEWELKVRQALVSYREIVASAAPKEKLDALNEELVSLERTALQAIAVSFNGPISEIKKIHRFEEQFAFALGLIEKAIVANAAVQGLVGRRDIEPEIAKRAIILFRRYEDALQAARALVDIVDRVVGCNGELVDEAEKTGRRSAVVPPGLNEILRKEADGKDDQGNAIDKELLAGEPLVYAARPRRLDQRVETAASAIQALELGAALSAALPVQGVNAAAAAQYANAAIGRVGMLERVPLVVGFVESNGGPNTGDAALARFGWVLGPRAVLDPQNKQIVLRHVVTDYDLVVDISLPGWWTEFDFEVETAWVGNWDRGDVFGRDEKRRHRQTLSVKRKLSRADLDGLTALITSELLASNPQLARVDRIEPSSLSLCGENDLSLLAYGANLWRGTDMALGGVPAKEGTLKVLPDMEGVTASFSRAALQEAISGSDAMLTVWTQNGFDLAPVSIARRPGADGKCVAVPATPPPPTASVVRIEPALVSPCSQTLDFAVTFSGMGSELAEYFLFGSQKVPLIKKERELTPDPQKPEHTIARFRVANARPGGVPIDRGVSPISLLFTDTVGRNAKIDVVRQYEPFDGCSPPKAS